ncbi:ShlB/FhaC/HecB family hemolysin secretion/activation protein [Billgrantia zhangzhouensis]|nr:ShlB/FhaC/HecB family hemolysin secretion/activation protein [Halomonas zhangzhouensis]
MDAVRQGIAGCFTQATGSKTVGRERRLPRLIFMPALLALSLPTALLAQDATPDEALRRQQEREQAIQERELPQADIRLSVPVEELDRLPEQEAPCFVIDELALQGEEAQRFVWVLDATTGERGEDSPIGRCLGTEGINLVMKRAQNALIERGFITSRILLEDQDLSAGTLTLSLVPGRIAAIRVADPSRSHASLRNAVPARQGDVLNLRDIEQALENFQRLPSVEADIQIAPADAPGASDLVIDYQQDWRLRPSWTADDSGSEATGEYMGGVGISLDNPLGINDLFHIHLGRDLGGGASGPRGSRSHSLHYSVPWGYWSLALDYSDHDYYQTIAGAFQEYVYSGTSQQAGVTLSRLVYRDATRKTTVSLGGFQRRSRNYIDDIEIEIQRRVVGGWEAGIEHREFIGRATLDLGTAYKRGTGAFGSLPAPEEAFDEGTSRFQLVSTHAGLTLPFQVGGQALEYRGRFRMQNNLTPLTPLDRFSIGSRYTVRGFNEASLVAERGWLVRNDLGLALGNSGQSLYAGLDYGRVSGPSTEWLLGSELAGAVAGLRGSLFGHLSYDAFIATPVMKPDGFRTDHRDIGFSFYLSF